MMIAQEKAKAAVEWLEEFVDKYLEGVGNAANVGSPIDTLLSATRLLADGTHVLVSKRDLVDLCEDQIAFAKLQYPDQSNYPHQKIKYEAATEIANKYLAAIKASQEPTP